MVNDQINLNFLRIFIEAAESNSLAEVAEKMEYEASTISINISTLEKQLGVTLFTRNPLRLTDVGNEIYVKVKRAYRDIEYATMIAKNRNDIRFGKLSIGCPSHIANYFLSEKIEKVLKDYQDVEIDLDCESPCKLMLEKLKINKLQFALLDFIPSDDDIQNFRIKQLNTSKYIFVSKNPIEIKEVEELNGYNYIMSDDDYKSSAVKFLEYLKQYNVNIKPKIRCKTTEMRIKFAKMDLGIAYVIKDAVKSELKRKELYEVKLPNEIVFPNSTIKVVYIKNRLTKVDKQFIDKYLIG